MEKTDLFRFQDYRLFLRDVIKASPRGFQAKLASAMGCQAIYLIRSLKGEAQLTEEQGYRAAQFLDLTEIETEYFLDILRLAKASDPDLVVYLRKRLIEKTEAAREISQRVKGKVLVSSLEAQIEYYSSWKPSILHLATSCAHLQTDAALAERFSLDLNEVREIMGFLKDSGLVTVKNGKYQFSGASIHLPKGSSLHKVFQRGRRDLVIHALGEPQKESLHFSSAFATSKRHCDEIRSALLSLIERIHRELPRTESEDLQILAMDFCKVM